MKADSAVGLLVVIAIAVGVGSCDDIQNAPKLIRADGETYLACQNLVWVNRQGGLFGGSATFKVSYTDAAGLSHALWGLNKVEVSGVPKTLTAPMPLNPGRTDSTGRPYIEGQVYHWPDGTKGHYQNGEWRPVEVPNDPCVSK